MFVHCFSFSRFSTTWQNEAVPKTKFCMLGVNLCPEIVFQAQVQITWRWNLIQLGSSDCPTPINQGQGRAGQSGALAVALTTWLYWPGQAGFPVLLMLPPLPGQLSHPLSHLFLDTGCIFPVISLVVCLLSSAMSSLYTGGMASLHHGCIPSTCTGTLIHSITTSFQTELKSHLFPEIPNSA